MTPLGLGLDVGDSIGEASAAAVVIEDYMWELDGGGGALKPKPTTYDFHDTWDLDGTDYTLQAVGDIGDEGYWDLDSNSDVQPLDV